MKYKFNFTIIVPIYNMEKYLEDTILSVINQTINFKENIQIILVNDGSTDNSELICKKYANKYPNNIKYIKQENAGVSAARNKGLKYAQGKYINFLDADDMWQKGVFSKVLKMFEANTNIPMIGVRQKFFEAKNGFMALDYKFHDGSRIVDITKEFDKVQLSVTSAFFDIKYIKDILFDTRIKYSEDAKFIYEMLIKNRKKEYGLIASPYHLYRKRSSQDSAVQTKDSNSEWYFITPKLSYEYLLELANNEMPELINTIGYYIMYDYQWRMKVNVDKFLNKEDKQKYLQMFKELIKKIPDKCITMQRKISDFDKKIILNHKHYNDFEKINLILKNELKPIVFINKLEWIDSYLILGGYLPYFKNHEIQYYMKINNDEETINLTQETYEYKNNFWGEVHDFNGFKIKIKLNELKNIEFYCRQKNETDVKIKLDSSNKIWNKKLCYAKHRRYLLYLENNDSIKIEHKKNILGCFLKEIYIILKFNRLKDLLPKVYNYILHRIKK